MKPIFDVVSPVFFSLVVHVGPVLLFALVFRLVIRTLKNWQKARCKRMY